MSVTVRFAPSPTGRIHAGNIRTAMFNHLFARRAGGRLIFRLDDTDRERSTEEFARGIEEDLHWLGVDWAEKVRQSDRFDRYAEAVEKLKASGRLYPAYETPEELELKRKRQLARGKPPVYDRAALQLTAEERAQARGGRAQAALAVSCSSSATWCGTTSCAGGSMSMPPRCQTRCWSGPTAAISIRCRAWSTTSISASPM